MQEIEPNPDGMEQGEEFERNFAENEYEKRGSIPVRK